MEKTVAVIGAGLIGRAWAMVFARAGWRVRLHDRDRAQLDAARRVHRGEPRRAGGIRARRRSRGGIGADRPCARAGRRAGRRGLGPGEPAGDPGRQARSVRARSTGTPRRRPCSRARRRRSRRRSSPRRLPGRARCLVAHPVNPPHLVPVVELCGAPWTAPAVIERAKRVYAEVGTGAHRRASRDRRLHPQPAAGRAAVGGDASRRRGLRVAARPRQDGARRPRPALVVHGAARDDRAECARRHRRLLRALRRRSIAGSPRRRPRAVRVGCGQRRPGRRRARPAAAARTRSMRARAGATAG